MVTDGGLINGIVGGVMFALTLSTMVTVANVLWTYNPLTKGNATLEEWASGVTGGA